MILLIPLAVGMSAMAVDLGYAVLIRSQLQVAADSAVRGAARRMGTSHEAVIQAARSATEGRQAVGKPVVVGDSDVQMGLWNTDARTFTPSGTGGNAVRVIARLEEPEGRRGPPYLARLTSTTSPDVSASAVAVSAPRDIVFVVDLSGAMNDLTSLRQNAEPGQASREGQTELVERLFDDFGFGAYPGELEHIGRFANVPDGPFAYAELTANGGPMTGLDVPSQYRINPDDDEPTRKRKCYSALIDLQVSLLMPAARPIPDSSANYEYWEKYLDYVIHSVKVTRPTRRGLLPPRQDRNRICRSDCPASECLGNKIGYRSYLQFMLDSGRDLKPDGIQYAALSQHSPDCPWRAETTAGGRLEFPPRTEPMHSVRRALIAAFQEIKRRNLEMGNPALADRVAIVTYDSLAGGGPMVRQSLTTDIDSATRACTRLQAVGDRKATSAADSGMELAREHLRPVQEGGQGRWAAKKVVVLLAAGVPDVCSADRFKVDQFVRVHPSKEFYSDGSFPSNAALVSAARMRAGGCRVYPVAVGSLVDADFFDRLARLGGAGESYAQNVAAAVNASDAEGGLVGVLKEIVSTTEVQLVQ